MAQWVKNPALSLQWLRLLLWHRFNPWPRNFCMPWTKPKKKTNKQTKKKHQATTIPVFLRKLLRPRLVRETAQDLTGQSENYKGQ